MSMTIPWCVANGTAPTTRGSRGHGRWEMAAPENRRPCSGLMSRAVSSRKMASWGDLPAMAPHMVAGTGAKTAGAMRPRMSVHTSLTSVVAQTMGGQFPGCAQYPYL